jgi:hypothetical protein
MASVAGIAVSLASSSSSQIARLQLTTPAAPSSFGKRPQQELTASILHMQVWSILYSFFACRTYLHVTVVVVVVMLFISLFGSWRESRSSFCIVCFLWLYSFFSSKAQLDWFLKPFKPLNHGKRNGIFQ